MNQEPNDLKSTVATIDANLQNLINTVNDIRTENRGIIKGINDRLALVENTQAKQGERISNWNVFQVAFSSIIGAIATYLGYKSQ